MPGIAFILGNGRSRASIMLNQLLGKGLIVGCNALYRDFTPDILIATDPPISEEIQKSGYALKHEFWTRKPLNDKGARKLEKPYYGMSSGPAAASRACLRGCTIIYLIGFDLGSPTKFVNNIYAGSLHYKKEQDGTTYYGNWVTQLQLLADRFENVKFIRVMGKESTVMDFKRKNIEIIDLNDFQTRINKL